MNRENFSDYLEEPSKLYQLSYQELKSLVLQHPYCANLHILLLQKSQMDGHTEFSKNLEKAAVHTFDRRFLYELIKSQKHLSISKEEFVAFEEEILELQDINSLEEKVQKIPLVANENDTSSALSREASPPTPPSPNWENVDPPLVDEPSLELDFELPEQVSPPKPEEGMADNEQMPPPGPADIVVNASDEIPSPTEPKIEKKAFFLSSSLVDSLVSIGTLPTFMLSSIPSPVDQLEDDDHFLEEPPLATQEIEQPDPEEIQESKPQVLPTSAQTTIKEEEQPDEELLNALKSRMRSLQLEVVVPHSPPQPKKNFSSWKRQLKPRSLPKPSNNKFREPNPPPPGPEPVKKEGKSMKVSEIAKRSLEDRVDIASETLAQLLAKQEQYPKAIDMYERLKLKFPQKSVYFAGKIEELIKLM